MKKYSILIIIFILGIFNTSQAQEISREEQINELLRAIISSTENNISWELDSFINMNLDNHEFKDALRYISNNRNLKNKSLAYEGVLGKLNKKKHKKRKRKFNKKIKRNWRDNNSIKDKQKKVILAEGDSWFMFPIFVKDILHHLIKEDNFALTSLAYGGDWLSNMIQEETYLDEYEKICPDVMLLSGGGNDMVGNNNLAAFLKTPAQVEHVDTSHLNDYFRALALKKLMCQDSFCETEIGKKIIDSIFPTIASSYQQSKVDSFFKELVRSGIKINSNNVYDFINIDDNKDGAKYVNQSYVTFLNVVQLEYIIILEQIKYSNPHYFNDLHIILQGYDYSVPSSKRGYSPTQYFTNSKIGMDNGHWLEYPMKLKGIFHPRTQRNIMKDLIDQYYSILEQIRLRYDNISIIDSRNVVAPDDWHDELHPCSKDFKRIAQAYIKAINSGERKIYKVVKIAPE